MKAAIHFLARCLKELEDLQEHKIREQRECVQKNKHSEEILNVSSLDFSFTLMDEINTVQR